MARTANTTQILAVRMVLAPVRADFFIGKGPHPATAVQNITDTLQRHAQHHRFVVLSFNLAP